MALIEISQGYIKGGKTSTDSGVSYYEFLCIPYAKPPVGNLRFKSPEPLEKWDGVLDATEYKEDKVCVQIISENNSCIGYEDCLYLNVYTPKLPESDSKLLPVMVFIHGGGFVRGNGINNKELGPQYLIDKNVVIVSLNYRLGVLGFLNLNIPEASGNMGLKDQVQGLKWVQQNIDKFGGDPHNVTLFGMSAGSVCVECHLASPLSEGLFHKAILQSGSSLSSWSINQEPFEGVLKLIKKMGYTGSTEDKKAILEFLVASPINILSNKAGEVDLESISARGRFEFIPTIEKNFSNGNEMLTENPYKLIKDGQFNRVPTIMGVCENEGYFLEVVKTNAFRDISENKNFADYLPYKLEENKDAVNKHFLSVYSMKLTKGDDDKKLALDFFADLDFVGGCYLRGDIMARKGIPVYFYEFHYDGNINHCKIFFNIKRKGPTHGDEWAYIFEHGVVSKSADEKDASVRETVTKLWTNFAKTSDPTPNDDLNIRWPSYNTSKCCLFIDEKPEIQSNYLSNRKDIFTKMFNIAN